MSEPGKIIKLDAFMRKDESFSSLNRPASENNPRLRLRSRENYYVAGLILVVAMTLAIMMTPTRKSGVIVQPVGAIAIRNVKAPEETLIEDRASTEKNRRKAEAQSLDLYDFDDRAATAPINSLRVAFAFMEEYYRTNEGSSYSSVMAALEKGVDLHQSKKEPSSLTQLMKRESSPAFSDAEKEFQALLGVTLDEAALKSARYYHYWPRIGTLVGRALTPAYNKGIITDNPPPPLGAVTLRRLSTSTEKRVEGLADLLDLTAAKKRTEEEVVAIIPENRPGLRRLVTAIALPLVRPNVVYNGAETRLRKEKAAADAESVFFNIKQGEIIVREGDRLTETDVIKLEGLASKEEEKGPIAIFFGFLLVNLLIVTLATFFIQKFHDEIRTNSNLQLFMALLLLLHMGLIWTTSQAATIFMPQTPGVGVDSYILAAPLIFGPMIVSIFFTTELTVIFTLIVAALTGLLLRDLPLPPILTIIGGMICAYHVRSYQRRSSVFRVALTIAAINVIVTQAFDMIGVRFLSESQIYDAGFAFIGGCLAALLVSGALPLMESAFPVVSDIKLLELSSLNHPLLRQMIMRAPGTYHHSIMVGTLAEEACKVIGANALLARVGALFHDIGKMKKAEYFVENNLRGEENPHDKLNPSMSTLIITNHIREGLEMAKKHKLMPQIACMIPEHHGTQLVKYFYHKSVEAHDSSRGEIKESDFRYPGPIPSSRESACVALADSIEAAGRACKEPTPLRLRGVVSEVINDKFVQGQLDNSHLTLHDLALLTDSFTHVLGSIHHGRIQYPDAQPTLPKEATHGGNGTPSQKTAKVDTGDIGA